MAGKRTPASSVALGGVLAVLAVVVMCLGTIIPVATYVCPMLCALLLQVVLKTCGVRIAWAWYGAVAILSLLLAPDKEAAAVFAVSGLLSHCQAPAGQDAASLAVERAAVQRVHSGNVLAAAAGVRAYPGHGGF